MFAFGTAKKNGHPCAGISTSEIPTGNEYLQSMEWYFVTFLFYFYFLIWYTAERMHELNMTKAQTFGACYIMWQRAREYFGLPNENKRFDFSLKRWKEKLSACWILLIDLLDVVMCDSLQRASGLCMVFIVHLLPSKLCCPFGKDLYIQSNSEDNVNYWEFNEAFIDHCGILASTSERNSVLVHVDHIL